jgi:hypothetical protein
LRGPKLSTEGSSAPGRRRRSRRKRRRGRGRGKRGRRGKRGGGGGGRVKRRRKFVCQLRPLQFSDQNIA